MLLARRAAFVAKEEKEKNWLQVPVVGLVGRLGRGGLCRRARDISFLQHDTSGCSKPPVDIDVKVAF